MDTITAHITAHNYKQFLDSKYNLCQIFSRFGQLVRNNLENLKPPIQIASSH